MKKSHYTKMDRAIAAREKQMDRLQHRLKTSEDAVRNKKRSKQLVKLFRRSYNQNIISTATANALYKPTSDKGSHFETKDVADEKKVVDSEKKAVAASETKAVDSEKGSGSPSDNEKPFASYTSEELAQKAKKAEARIEKLSKKYPPGTNNGIATVQVMQCPQCHYKTLIYKASIYDSPYADCWTCDYEWEEMGLDYDDRY